MITETITVSESSSSLLDIGRQGETLARQVVFDLTYLVDTFGSGTAELVHQRSQDDLPYQVDAVQEDGTLTWTVSDTDTAYEGFGRCEIRWTVGDTLAKTVIYKTRVLKSITAETEIPEPYESWYDAMVAYLDARTLTSATAQTLPAGSSATAQYSGGVLTIGVPTGNTGAQGEQGIQGEQGPTGNGIASIEKTGTAGNVDTYTITMTDGSTATFDVTNGSVTSVNGDTGAVTVGITASGTDGTVTLTV